MVKKESLQKKILKTISLLVLIPMAIIAVVSIAQIYNLGSVIGTQGATSIENEGIKTLQNKSADAASYVNTYLLQAEVDLDRIAQYESDLYSGKINITEFMRSSYQQGALSSQSLSSSDRYAYLLVNSSVSDYVLHTTLTAAINSSLNVSAYMDYICDNVLTRNLQYVTIKMGFEIGYSRVFPYINNSRALNENLLNSQWYQSAKLANGIKQYSNLNLSFGHPVITISKGVYNQTNGAFLGVVALDLDLTTLRTNFANMNFGKSGYLTLVNTSGYVVAHPSLTVGLATERLEILESNPDEFNELQTNISTSVVINGILTKDDEEWNVAGIAVKKGNMYCLAMIPNSELKESGLTLQSKLNLLGTPLIITFIFVLIALVIFMIFFVTYMSKRITQPLKTLTEAVENMGKGDLSKEIPLDPRNKKNELGLLAQSFQSLLTTMRLGNQMFYRGDMNLAYANYSAGLQLFETVNNKKGMGVCLNNLANIYRMWGNYEKAIASYNQAIQIAEELNDQNGLASRLNNRGLVFLSTSNWSQAQNDFERALRIDQTLNNEDRIAMRKRNMGILHLLKNEIKDAEAKISEAFALDKKADYPAGLAEDHFQLGRVAIARKDFPDAESHFQQAIELAKSIDNLPLMRNILVEMIENYDAQKNTMLMHKAQAELAKINDVLVRKKDVVFVIDRSGSMQEHGKMGAARIGALDVFNTKINDGDKVGIIGFHSVTEVLLTPSEKGANFEKIRGILQNLDFTPYQTAFYDALGQGIESVKNTPEDHQKWVVSLTDGMDNSSQRFNANSLAAYIKILGFQLHMIIIGVGPELKDVSSQLVTVVNATQQGKYIPIYSTQNVSQRIQEAFKQVKEIMAASEIEGFTPEAK